MIGALIHLTHIDNPRLYLDKVRIELFAMGIDTLIIIDKTKYKMASYFHTTELNYHIFNTLDEAEEIFNDIEFIYLEPKRVLNNIISTPLYEFKHPENVIYVSGPDPSTIPLKGRENKKWVEIEMKQHGVLYGLTTLILVAYDRKIKEQLLWQ